MSAAREAILRNRFYHPGESNWSDVCARAANAWGDSPEHRKALYEMQASRRALFNTPANSNAGRAKAMGSACYVLPIRDSLVDGPASIMGTLHDAAAVHKSGGGTGFSLGEIRGKGTLVTSTGRPAPGAVNVLRLYSDDLDRVTQAGMRAGANMGIYPVDGPDIRDFISCKKPNPELRSMLMEAGPLLELMDPEVVKQLWKLADGGIHNFNISVGMTDAFMAAITEGTATPEQQEIWNLIVQGAWANGEPGLFFIDTTNNASQHPHRYMHATNPCGEQPLRPYEACVLGSVNWAAHLTRSGDIDWALARDTIWTLVRGLDNIVEWQHYPIPEIKQEQQRYRKIGVGPMGLADTFIRLGLVYGEDLSVKLAEEIARFTEHQTYEASEALADEKGPYWGYHQDAEIPAPGDDPSYFPELPYRRNICCQTVAPTGTISRLAGVWEEERSTNPGTSFSIEPIQAAEVMSFIVGGQFHEIHPLRDDPCFITSEEVSIDAHLAIQAAFQRHVDAGVSKTLNVPNATTKQEVSDLYIKAWQLGLKGTTILRQGSREEEVLKALPAKVEVEPDAQEPSDLPVSIDCASGVCSM